MAMTYVVVLLILRYTYELCLSSSKLAIRGPFYALTRGFSRIGLKRNYSSPPTRYLNNFLKLISNPSHNPANHQA